MAIGLLHYHHASPCEYRAPPSLPRWPLGFCTTIPQRAPTRACLGGHGAFALPMARMHHAMNELAGRPRAIATKLVALYLGVTVLDLCVALTVSESSDPIATVLLLAVMPGQLAIAAAWAVLAPRQVIERTLTAVLATACCLGAGILPMALNAQLKEPLAPCIWLLPWVLLSLQIPLWTCRLIFGWHVVKGSEPGPAAPARRQFGMRQLLAAVTIIAVWLGLFRLSMANADGWGDFEPVTFAALISWTLWLGMLMVPCVYVAMGARNAIEASISLAFAFCSLTFIAVLVDCVLGDRLLLFAAMLSHGTFLAVFYGAILVARRDGFVLRWAPRRPRGRRP